MKMKKSINVNKLRLNHTIANPSIRTCITNKLSFFKYYEEKIKVEMSLNLSLGSD